MDVMLDNSICRSSRMTPVGNARDDRLIFARVHAIIADEADTLSHKLLALKAIDEAMGLEDGEYTQEAVDEYLLYSWDGYHGKEAS